MLWDGLVRRGRFPCVVCSGRPTPYSMVHITSGPVPLDARVAEPLHAAPDPTLHAGPARLLAVPCPCAIAYVDEPSPRPLALRQQSGQPRFRNRLSATDGRAATDRTGNHIVGVPGDHAGAARCFDRTGKAVSHLRQQSINANVTNNCVTKCFIAADFNLEAIRI